MPIIKEQVWKEYVEKNQDPYGKCCVDIARQLMLNLDAYDGEIKDCHAFITQAEKQIGEDGITGFMAGAIAHMVASVHSRGDEFRKAWNKSWGNPEAKGTVNPAVITIKDYP